MKKFLLFGCIFLLGIILGSIFSLWIYAKSAAETSKTAALMNISELETLSSDIYKTGEYESSVIILNHLVKKLKYYIDHLKDNFEAFSIDRGLAHGRLFIIYNRKGEEKLAEAEFKEAIDILGEKYDISSKDGLVRTIKKFDDLEK